MSGFLKFDNDVLESIYSRPFSSDKEVRILLYIIRMIVGFHQSECELSASRISKNTNIPIRTVRTHLSRLIESGVIKKRTGGRNNTNIYSLGSAICGSTGSATHGSTGSATGGSTYKYNSTKYNSLKKGEDYL